MMRLRTWGGIVLALFLGTTASAEIFTLYSDNGIPSTPANTVITYGCSLQWPLACFPAPQETFDGNSLDLAPPEGHTSWKTASTFPLSNEYAGWGIAFSSPQDLSRFHTNGELRFWIYSTTTKVKFGMSNNSGPIMEDLAMALPVDQWVFKRIKLSNHIATAAPMATIKNPFLFTSYDGPGIFYIDNVRLVDSTTSPIFDVRLCNLGDTACVTPASEFTWNTAVASSTWRIANQYIKLTLDADSTLWGVQIYTNNRDAGANPQYIVNGSSNPMGLVNTVQRTLTVPLAWSIKAGTAPVSNVTPVAAEPNNGADTNSFQWIYMKDALTPNIPRDNTTAFVPGEIPVTVKNNVGIHYGQQNTDFGAETPPNYIFLEADFGKALAQQTYRTNTLTVEFFNL